MRRNIIASSELFAERIIGHPFKYECHQIGAENSEDTLSWNVFRSLQEAGRLAEVAKLMVAEVHAEEPHLYLWGIRVDDDSFEPWDLLIAARQRFESHLPEPPWRRRWARKLPRYGLQPPPNREFQARRSAVRSGFSGDFGQRWMTYPPGRSLCSRPVDRTPSQNQSAQNLGRLSPEAIQEPTGLFSLLQQAFRPPR